MKNRAMVVRVRPGFREVDVLILDEAPDESLAFVRYRDDESTAWVPLGKLIADGSYPEILRSAQEVRT